MLSEQVTNIPLHAGKAHKGQQMRPHSSSFPTLIIISPFSQLPCVHPRHWQGGNWILSWIPLYAASEMGICGQEAPSGMLLWLDWGRNWTISHRRSLSTGPAQSSGAGMALQNCPKLGQGAWALYTSAVSSHVRGYPKERAWPWAKQFSAEGNSHWETQPSAYTCQAPQHLRKLSASLPKVGPGQNSPASTTELQGVPDFSSHLPAFYELRTQIPSGTLLSFGI